ncbi:hydrolase [Listeria weihenstephanensis FSL R9-0317]|uniref:Alpha/beta hydrolase n=1 Tax=Listeria weihenstephanensis TaxID=1006155 RepID=A0A1S7FUC5_9LIST|nr:alpha/beta hydrolase [Listeria weihenstephanensis]AQY50970.1 alpha/beta hydrolase [Listeria weihenstephanensis]EUJ36380.1 hydrolase [Listeria weihenstephanensis FSL R9-0317]MBC1499912.1 alpha/beta hydrolase [Listeria weihenstephanensis]
MHTELKIETHDQSPLHVHIWEEVQKPVGIVQIVHGMAEHGARYADFAHYLNGQGFIVIADDHRGFGKSAKDASMLGHLAFPDGFEAMVADEEVVAAFIKERHPNLPHFIFGHSMGSFITRVLITRYKVGAAVLAGSGLQPDPILKAGLFYAKLRAKNHETKRSAILHKASFYGFNREFASEKHPFSWLSRDKAVHKTYTEDPFCGQVVGSLGFYHSLLFGIEKSQNIETIEKTPKDVPLLLISGSKDPVGHFGKDVPKLAVKYEKAGVGDVTLKIYEDARHELTNEINKEQVFEDVVSWYKKQLGE